MNPAATHNRLAELRLVAFDVDGVFTDGRFRLSDDGVESKAFNTQDGFGIRRLLDAGHEVTVITGVPNFPRGEVYDGYRNRPFQRESIAGPPDDLEGGDGSTAHRIDV